MEGFVKGDIVVVPFPFTDFSELKRRPALVSATTTGNDVILCSITTKERAEGHIVEIESRDLVEGSLRQPSKIRPGKIATMDSSMIFYKIGKVSGSKMREVEEAIVGIFTS